MEEYTVNSLLHDIFLWLISAGETPLRKLGNWILFLVLGVLAGYGIVLLAETALNFFNELLSKKSKP